MVQRANEAVMERQRFAIDDVGDDDDGEDLGAGEEEDDGVMDEVSFERRLLRVWFVDSS